MAARLGGAERVALRQRSPAMAPASGWLVSVAPGAWWRTLGPGWLAWMRVRSGAWSPPSSQTASRTGPVIALLARRLWLPPLERGPAPGSRPWGQSQPIWRSGSPAGPGCSGSWSTPGERHTSRRLPPTPQPTHDRPCTDRAGSAGAGSGRPDRGWPRIRPRSRPGDHDARRADRQRHRSRRSRRGR